MLLYIYMDICYYIYIWIYVIISIWVYGSDNGMIILNTRLMNYIFMYQ